VYPFHENYKKIKIKNQSKKLEPEEEGHMQHMKSERISKNSYLYHNKNEVTCHES
jgi:hypothetical protein